LKGSPSRTLVFRHLHLQNWRNFEKADFALQSRAFIVGPNASGKSNLLDVFRFLRDIVSVGGGFQEAVRNPRGGVSKLRCLSARRHPDVLIRTRIGSEAEPNLWEYELAFSQDNQRRPIVRGERVAHKGVDLWRRPDDQDKRDPERLTETYLEQISANKEFRDVADFLKSVRYLHVVPQLIREPDRSVGHSEDPFGGDFLEQISRTPEKTRNAWLRRIRDALKVAVPQLQELEFYREENRGTPHLRGKYVHWRPQGAWQNEDQFSDGTLRLVGLLWSVLEGSGPLLMEEPELSLHPDVVAQLPAIFARLQRRTGRQVILSTHSPALLGDPGVGLDEVLLLVPDAEGTVARPASSVEQIVRLLEAGDSLADAVLPHTRPPNAFQLGLFGE
jgi:predicted ATPase